MEVSEDFVSLEDDLMEVSEDFVSLEDDITSSYFPWDSWLEEELEEHDREVNKQLLLEQEEIESHMKKIVVLDDAEVCSVCLQDIDVGDENVTVLNCNSHIFHKKCMQEWSRRKPNCPLCRHDMREERQPKLKRKRLPHHDDEELTRLKL
ncbi:hypothetical protein MKW98_026959 [Papaver atlanticum]|uniref:RING-type domain-containing protein n=1 Tax=Papaver atlanticum TaxID=357466 RepID=A0AAD4SV05_9MAGN|nr:hypothetical protein MKW98_026959 [Papaver atlanticum]